MFNFLVSICEIYLIPEQFLEDLVFSESHETWSEKHSVVCTPICMQKV